MPKFAKLAARGAWGAVGAIAVAYILFARWLTWPNGTGIDPTEAWVAWISVGIVVAALEWIHVIYARILRGVADGRRHSIENAWWPPEGEKVGVTGGSPPRPL